MNTYRKKIYYIKDKLIIGPNENNRGFIALFSVIIISFILVLVVITLSFNSFSTRFNIFDSESKIRSKALADGCLELARLNLALDNNFVGNNIIIDIDSDKCDYSIQNTLPYKTVISHSIINNAHTYIEALVDVNTPSIAIISFRELPTYP